MSIALLSLLVACKNVEPAPEDIDGLAHYFWQGYDGEDPAVIAAGVVNLHKALDPGSLDEPLTGTISDLDQDEIELVGKGDDKASKAAGIVYGGVIDCPLADVEEGVIARNQDERHEGDYDSYDRDYTSDYDAYMARDEEFLTWQTHYAVSGLGYEYDAVINGGARYVVEIDDETTPHGPILLSRGVLDAPAYFEEGDTDRGMFQDYQLEIYYEYASGKTAHLYAIWREMVLIGDVTFDDDGPQDLVLDGLEDWDADTEEHCGE